MIDGRVVLGSFLIICVMLLGTLVAGCGNNSSVGTRDKGSADILNFPDHFRNVAMKCDGHGHRVYSTDYNGGGAAVAVINDPSCK